MATSLPKIRVPRIRVDAVEILKREHRTFARQFQALFAAHSAHRRRELATQLCNELKIHFALEEDIFFPAFVYATQDTLTRCVAFIHHESAKSLIEEIEGLDPVDSEFLGRAHALSRMISHHSNEAERPNGIFDEARTADMDWTRVGTALLERKQALERYAD